MNHLPSTIKNIIFGSLWLAGLGSTAALPAIAQVTTDGSLSTAVDPVDGNRFLVTGGQVAGPNLFHSFEQFSVPTGGAVEFNHGSGVETIFSRVTGAGISTIDGSITANASLYLLNPQGIIFGPNAQLQLGGDFVATTAEQVQFEDGFSFPTQAVAEPLLSLGIPVGLQLGAEAGSILVQAQGGDDGLGNAVGLAVMPGSRLSLVAGEIELDQGRLTAAGGLLSLVALTEGTVALEASALAPSMLTNDGEAAIASGGEIRLGQGARLTTSGEGDNGVRLLGDRITLNDQSLILADNLGPTTAQGIAVKARSFSLEERSLLASSALSSGPGGSIVLNVDETIELTGTGYANLEQTLVLGALAGQSSLASRDRLTGVVTGGNHRGDSGAVLVTVPEFRLREGAVIWAPTFGFGKGGDIQLQVSQTLDHSASAIATSAYFLGEAGSLTIETDRFDITQSAFLNTSTFSPAPGGNVKIRAGDLTLSDPLPNTVSPTAIFSSSIGSTGIPGDVMISSRSLSASSGAQITSTGGVDLPIAFIPVGGPGGNVSIEAEESVVLTGVGDFQPTQFSATSYSTFPAGSLSISTPLLIVQDGARLLATSNAGEGGNISVQADDILLLRNSSDITATATGIGDGGNIELDTSRLLLLGNSRVTANAERGLGGTIDISSRLLLQSVDSQITASSALGKDFSGQVQLNQAQVKSTQLDSVLPKTLLESDDERIIAACNPEEEQEFIVSGRGGLPLGVWHSLESQPLWRDGRSRSKAIAASPQRMSLESGENALGSTGLDPRQEAIAFQRDANGRIVLVLRHPVQEDGAMSSALLSQAEVCQQARKLPAG